MSRFGVLILCGGESSRMGRAKADLPFGNEAMLTRIERRLRPFGSVTAVVAAADQPLPALPASVKMVRDQQPKLGPLEGLRVGLSALEADADLVLATGCDLPFLSPVFGHSLAAICATDYEMLVTELGKHVHPMPALIRPRIHHIIARLLANGERRVTALLPMVQSQLIKQETLLTLGSHELLNVNRPADYELAIEILRLESES